MPSARDSAIASVRLRCLVPSRYLNEAGWRTELLVPERLDDYAVVIFQKAYDEWALALASELRSRRTVTVFDLCDNHLYNPDGLPALAERADRLRRMLELVDAVSVSSEPLRRLVEDRDPPVIDDAFDELEGGGAPVALRRIRRIARRRSDALRLVWYGNAGMDSPPFGLVHLPLIVPVLEDLHRLRPIELTVISNSRERYARAVARARFPSRYVEWTRAGFAVEFRHHDICVLPIEPNPFTVCKTANRLALSLTLGVPVVADPIPSFAPFAGYVLLGDWPTSLAAYAGDPELRARHVEAGAAFVRSTYTPERVVAQWGGFFERLLADRW